MVSLTLEKLFILIPPLILVEGFFAGSEIALFCADRLTLKAQAKKGNGGASLALKLIQQPEQVLAVTLLMTSLCIISASCLIAFYFLERDSSYGELSTILVTSPLVVLLGELIPKTIYQRNANFFATWVSYPISWLYWIFFPITRMLSFYTSRLARIVGPIEELLAGKRRTTRDEIQNLLSYSKSETEIKASEKRMIQRIFNFRDSKAKNVLIPLVRVDALEDSATLKDALEAFERHRHSRMPVFSNRIYNIIGVIEAADLLTTSDLNQPVRTYMTPAYYTPETQSLEDIMMEMKHQDHEMAIVVDEHGGSVGILTFEDIAEEIVGEINDEYDYESQPYKVLSESRWSVQASMEIQQINELLKLDIPEGNYETLSGFLLQQFSRIPENGAELFFDTPKGAFKFTIQKSTERHIEAVLIQRIDSS